jgi:hypothetical protein
MQYTQIYLPVTHEHYGRLVQVTNPNGDFCGWADGPGKFDRRGSWQVDDDWSPAQAAELGRIVAQARTYAAVTVRAERLARYVTCTL